MRPLPRIIATLGAAGVLSSVGACGWIESVRSEAETGRNGASASSAAVPGDSGGLDITDETGSGAGLRPPPLPRVKPKPPPLAAAVPGVAGAAAGVVGLTEDELETLLGPPKSRAVAEPARIREYESTICRIRLYLYVDLKTEKYKVLHLTTNPAGLDRTETGRCLTDIARLAAQGGGR
ncbi:MAG: hypothetical protein GEU92_15460 [Alphaproteobacteria bacterium]|nr:hypothetical protein [Alphaproteobacteria bacterium]